VGHVKAPKERYNTLMFNVKPVTVVDFNDIVAMFGEDVLYKRETRPNSWWSYHKLGRYIREELETSNSVTWGDASYTLFSRQIMCELIMGALEAFVEDTGDLTTYPHADIETICNSLMALPGVVYIRIEG
jgi:hypothetical protein